MKEKTKIKGLRIQLNKLEGERPVLKIQLSNTQKEYLHKRSAIEKIQKKIDVFDSQNTIEVSEHAIIRYFERILGYDFEDAKK